MNPPPLDISLPFCWNQGAAPDPLERPLHLPIPNPEEVARFQSLYQAEYGILLTEQQALELATRLVQYVFLTHYALPYLRSQEQRKRGQTDPVH